MHKGALTRENLIKLAAPHLNGAVVDIQEIGDGNLNFVYRVCSATNSVVVKHALDYIRISGGSRPLSAERVRYEADALEIAQDLTPGMVPRIVESLPEQGILVLEDLRGYRTLRDLCLSAELAEQPTNMVGEFLATTHLRTSALEVTPTARRILLDKFLNPQMVTHTVNVTFVRPYDGSQSSSHNAVVAQLAEELFRDYRARIRVEELRANFVTHGEALLHGDMHTGSVMVAGDDVRIFDPEFAMMGPIGFDLGCFLAHLVVAHTRYEVLGDRHRMNVLDNWAHRFWTGYRLTVEHQWPGHDFAAQDFLNRQLVASAGYAGLEMIRRVVGGAYVPETETLPEPERADAYRQVKRKGLVLLLERRWRTWDDLWNGAIS